MHPQLRPDEIDVVRRLREDEELTFDELAERLGVDLSTAHRIVTKPGYQFSDLVLIRIRKGLRRLEEAAAGGRRKAAAR